MGPPQPLGMGVPYNPIQVPSHPSQHMGMRQQQQAPAMTTPPIPHQPQHQNHPSSNQALDPNTECSVGHTPSTTQSRVAEIQNTVDSWEDIADEALPPPNISRQPQPSLTTDSRPPPAEDITTRKSDNGLLESRENAEKAETKLALESAEVATSATSSSSSIGSGSGGGSSNKKQPSPNLAAKSSKLEASKPTPSSQPPQRSKDDKENLNVIFIGHVDAGKSTIGGHVMYLTGQVDKRTLEKYEREAREKNRETWYLSWALDTNQEEREKGKTVEVGRASFETVKKRFTILDAPGHAGFVPNMIGGAAQADVGVLVISARKGEFETGFERKGQTREHAMLAKTAGVKHLVVLINKMDDSTVEWLEERYEECKTKLTPFLKKVGFNPKTDLFYIPVSGLTGANLKEVATEECSWYKGPPFITYLDNLPTVVREDNGIFRMPIADKYKDMGTLVMGKLESGAVMKGLSLLLMPNRVPVEVIQIVRVEEEVPVAYSGDNIKLRLKGVEEEDISPGFVLCDPSSPCNMSQNFEAQIAILEHKSIICAGYSAILHIHTVVEEVQITELKALIDRKSGKRVSRNPRFVKQDQVAIATLHTSGIICMENFKDFPQMARFTLRDEGKTIAIGKVLKLLK